MAQEFVARHGLISLGDVTVNGNITGNTIQASQFQDSSGNTLDNKYQPTITPTADTTPQDTDYFIFQRLGVWFKVLFSDLVIKLATVFAPKVNPIFSGNVKLPQYIYTNCASDTTDTINDRREYVASGVKYFQRCTVVNATKGGGTWINDLKINVDGSINVYDGVTSGGNYIGYSYNVLYGINSSGDLNLYTNGFGYKALSLLKTGDSNTISGKYAYQASSPTADTVNDIRTFNNAGVFTVQKCTVANATKGGGTWITTFTA